jgi:hypothetical protein
MGATCRAGTAPLPDHTSSLLVYSGVSVARSVVLCVMFCRLLFVLLSFFFWPLCCLSLDLRLLITPLVSSNFFYWYSFPSISLQLIFFFYNFKCNGINFRVKTKVDSSFTLCCINTFRHSSFVIRHSHYVVLTHFVIRHSHYVVLTHFST